MTKPDTTDNRERRSITQPPSETPETLDLVDEAVRNRSRPATRPPGLPAASVRPKVKAPKSKS